MKSDIQPSDDSGLSRLLREARPTPPSLPPRFQEAVWRRLEQAEIPATRGPSAFAGLERWVERLLQPRFALAGLLLLLLAGGVTGVIAGAGAAKQLAQERYLSAVAPNAFR